MSQAFCRRHQDAGTNTQDAARLTAAQKQPIVPLRSAPAAYHFFCMT